jgi:hypothetical protein
MEKKEKIVETPPTGGRLVYWNDKPDSIEFNMEVFGTDLRDALCHCRELGKRADRAYDSVSNIFDKIRSEYYNLGRNGLDYDDLVYTHIPEDELQPVYPHPTLPFWIKRLVTDHRRALDRFYLAYRERSMVQKSITPIIQARCGRPISYWYVEEQKVIAVFK